MTKTALVTGGARGIGRACALALADSGFDIALVDLLEREMASTARDIEARGKRTLTFQADVSDLPARMRSSNRSTRNGDISTCS